MQSFLRAQNNSLKIKQIQIIIPNFRLFAVLAPTFAAGNAKLLFVYYAFDKNLILLNPSFLFVQAV